MHGQLLSTLASRVPGQCLLALMCAALLSGGCALEVTNVEPAQRLAHESRPPGEAYLGWRVFQERCARCHGDDAQGTAQAPSLLERMRLLSARQFVHRVLDRYSWSAQGDPPAADSAAREAWVARALERKEEPQTMPVWQGEPVVSAHVMDLHAWLAARASGALGAGRPTP